MTKRFWTQAEAVPAETPGRFHVVLDGRPVRLPSGAVLSLPNVAIGQAVAAEWQQAGGAKGGDFTQAALPLTGLAGAAQERIAPQLAAMAATLAAYAQTDLLCYRVATPTALALEQQAGWQPWLNWAAARYAAPLHTTTGLTHLPQPTESLAALAAAIAARSIEELAALGLAIPALGSCVLGLALADTAITPAEAADLAALDELYQARQWGEDAEAAARRHRLRDEIALAARFMELSRI